MTHPFGLTIADLALLEDLTEPEVAQSGAASAASSLLIGTPITASNHETGFTKALYENATTNALGEEGGVIHPLPTKLHREGGGITQSCYETGCAHMA